MKRLHSGQTGHVAKPEGKKKTSVHNFKVNSWFLI